MIKEETTGFVILLVSLVLMEQGRANHSQPHEEAAAPAFCHHLEPSLLPGSPMANGLSWRHGASTGLKEHRLGVHLTETPQRSLVGLLWD